MKNQKKDIQSKISQIIKDINAEILDRHELKGMFIREISFSSEACDGEEICKYFGNDPHTGKPIIKCKCVKAKI